MVKPHKFTIPVSETLATRIYSAVFHDPRRRHLKDVINELIEESLSKRTFVGPAPAEWIAQHKVKGKPKKS